MTKDEALKLALEALNAMNPYPASKEQQRSAAITAIKEALTQPDIDPERLDQWVAASVRKHQRTWQGLTLGEAVEIWTKTEQLDEAIKLVEAKLKEKNT